MENNQLVVAVHTGKVEAVRFSLDSGALINEENEYGMIALTEAAYQGRLEIARLLLNNGAAINQPGNAFTLRALIRAGILADKEATDILQDRCMVSYSLRKMKLSALMWAAHQGKLEIVRLLLEHGAAIDASVDEVTALSLAESNGHKEVVELIKKQIKERETYPKRKEIVECTFTLFSQPRKPGEEERPEANIPTDVVSIIDGYMNPVDTAASSTKKQKL